jgi:hypothetical protein
VRRARVREVEEGLVGAGDSEAGVLVKFGKKLDEWVDLLSVMVGTKETSNYTSVPEGFRSHWSK